MRSVSSSWVPRIVPRRVWKGVLLVYITIACYKTILDDVGISWYILAFPGNFVGYILLVYIHKVNKKSQVLLLVCFFEDHLEIRLLCLMLGTLKE